MGKYSVPKRKILAVLSQIYEKSVYSTEKPILLNFMDLPTILSIEQNIMVALKWFESTSFQAFTVYLS